MLYECEVHSQAIMSSLGSTMQIDKLNPSQAKEGHVCCCLLAISVWFYICIECCLTSLE